MVSIRFKNGSVILSDKEIKTTGNTTLEIGNQRGISANQIWETFIDEDGNGCCTNVLTGDTYLDWTKEELDGE